MIVGGKEMQGYGKCPDYTFLPRWIQEYAFLVLKHQRPNAPAFSLVYTGLRVPANTCHANADFATRLKIT